MVVDLVALGAACRPLLAWYDDLNGRGVADPRELDRAVAQLAALPPISGRLGAAVRLLVSGGAANLDGTRAAIELLRRAVVPTRPAAPISQDRHRFAGRARRYDRPLPGLDVDEGHAGG
jgi:hypothetical protein